MKDVYQIIKEAHPFNQLEDGALRRFVEAAEVRNYLQNEILYIEGAQDDRIHLVLEGEARVQFSLANQENPFEVIQLGRGELLGILAFVESGARATTATASTDLAVLSWNAESWQRLSEEDPRAGYIMMRGVAQLILKRLRSMHIKIVDSVSWGFE